MTAQELAQLLNGREDGNVLTREETERAKADGLVVVFGYSDDNMEFRGAIDDEVGCYNGGDAYVSQDGVFQNECDEEDCPYAWKIKESLPEVTALWDCDGYSWVYKTEIPHCVFDVMEDGEKYCQGIVFNIKDLPNLKI